MWGTVRSGAAALRAIHDEQVLMRELFWQASRSRRPGQAGAHERTIDESQTHTRPGGTRRPRCVGAICAACHGSAATEVVNR